MSPDESHIYTSSPVSCKIRRVSTAKATAVSIGCTTRLVDLIHPAGCASYDESVDTQNTKVSSVSHNVHYNHAQNSESDPTRGLDVVGRTLHPCVGVPPLDTLDIGPLAIQMTTTTFDNASVTQVNEDTEAGTDIRVECPTNCQAPVFGTSVYSEDSSICTAAIHHGLFENNNENRLVLVTIERPPTTSHGVSNGSTQFNIESHNLTTDIQNTSMRFFRVSLTNVNTMNIQTLVGKAHGLLDSGCGFVDAEPAQDALVSGPEGLALATKSHLLYIADAANHRIRVLTSVCSKVCENGGSCVAPETCACTSGWIGPDCTVPICSGECGLRQVCTAPETCSCIPGYAGFPACTTPTCVQDCGAGGVCGAPDTCDCFPGWFDANCTTPVCSQTCGNGGNCTAPDTCTCPRDFSGDDCRVPQCSQVCANSDIGIQMILFIFKYYSFRYYSYSDIHI